MWRLTSGLTGLAKRSKVRVLTGKGAFIGPNEIEVRGSEGTETVRFQTAIIACGLEPVRLPFLPDEPRIMDSTGALALEGIPRAAAHHRRRNHRSGDGGGLPRTGQYDHGCRDHGQDLPGADADITRPLHKRIAARYDEVLLNTRVTGATVTENGIEVGFETGGEIRTATSDRVLVATGRRPNGDRIGAQAAGITPDARAFIPVDA